MPLFCYMTFSSSTLFVNMQKFYQHQRLVLTFVVNIFCILCGSCIFVRFLFLDLLISIATKAVFD